MQVRSKMIMMKLEKGCLPNPVEIQVPQTYTLLVEDSPAETDLL